jgi:hypothetical protein
MGLNGCRAKGRPSIPARIAEGRPFCFDVWPCSMKRFSPYWRERKKPEDFFEIRSGL